MGNNGKSVILAIDQGTTASKALLLDSELSVLAEASSEFPQHFPEPGQVEHELGEIFQSVRDSVAAALKAGSSGQRVHVVMLTGVGSARDWEVLRHLGASGFLLKPVDEAELAFFRSHRVGLVPLLPGTCYIEFAHSVAVVAHGPLPYTLGRIAFEVSWQPRCRVASVNHAHLAKPIPASPLLLRISKRPATACPSCRRRSCFWTKTSRSWAPFACACSSSAPRACSRSHPSLRKAPWPTTLPWSFSRAQQAHRHL